VTGTVEAGSVLPEVVQESESSWSARFSASTLSWDGVHGGTVIGAVLRAAASAVGGVPVSVTAGLHRPVAAGTAAIDLVERRGGRTAPSVRVEVRQDDVLATGSVLLRTDEVPAGQQAWPWRRPEGSALAADPEQLEPLQLPVELVPFGQHVDIRPLGSARPLAWGAVPELTAWVRLVAPTSYEPAVGAVLLDALAPSLYAVRTDPVPIPTVEMTAHLLVPSDVPEWLFVEQRTTWASASLCLDDAVLWAPDGRVVAQARQVRRIFLPRPAAAR